MNDSDTRRDPWALPTLLLWVAFFLVGLFPEGVFTALRDWSGVVTSQAYVNNPEAITIAFTFYLAAFVFMRCREAGLTDAQAQGRAVQVGLAGIIAFLWQPLGLLVVAGDVLAGSVWQRVGIVVAIYLTAFLKMLAWFYLLSLIVRYYGFGHRQIFAEMRCVFPSARVPRQEESKAVAPSAGQPEPNDAEWEVFPPKNPLD